MIRKILAVIIGFTALVGSAPALAQAYLGNNLRPFAVLAGSTVTCTGASTVTGDVGVSPLAAVVGFPVPCTDIGTIHTADAAAGAAQGDLTIAFTTLSPASLPCNINLTGVDLGGLTLVPGIYCFSSSAQLTGLLRLDAQGNPNATWVFQIGSTLTTAGNVTVINGGNPCAVQWRVGSSATLGAGSQIQGNILAQSSITLVTGANLIGRALARTAAVTLDTNQVSFAACGAGSGPGGAPGPFTPAAVPLTPGIPTLSEWAMILLSLLLVASGVVAMRKRF
jgi:hypothetical protein